MPASLTVLHCEKHSVSTYVLSAQVFAQHYRCPGISTLVLGRISSLKGKGEGVLKVILSRIPALPQGSQVSLPHLGWPQIPSWVSLFLYPKKIREPAGLALWLQESVLGGVGQETAERDKKGRAGFMARPSRQGQEP